MRPRAYHSSENQSAYYSEAGGSHTCQHSGRALTYLCLRRPNQPSSRKSSIDVTSTRIPRVSSRQQSGSRGSPLEAPLQDHSTRHCARSYVKAPEEASTPQVEETLVKLGRHLVNTSDNQACGKRSAGIISHSAGLGGILYLEPAWTQAGGRREREAR